METTSDFTVIIFTTCWLLITSFLPQNLHCFPYRLTQILGPNCLFCSLWITSDLSSKMFLVSYTLQKKYIPSSKRESCWKAVKILSEGNNRMEIAEGAKCWRYLFFLNVLVIYKNWLFFSGNEHLVPLKGRTELQCIVSVMHCFTVLKTSQFSVWQTEGSAEELKPRNAFCYCSRSFSCARVPESHQVPEHHHLGLLCWLSSITWNLPK